MSTWTPEQLRSFASADDLHIAPFRENGTTYGTPTFIWSVVAHGDLYVRPYNGRRSRWYQAALSQGSGRVSIAGTDYEVDFVPAGTAALPGVDDAYRQKYGTSPYLAPMIAPGPRSTTLRVTPRSADR
ncbi:DUF2255 family protein [Arthrobacter sp. NPDC057009]|uniref:DUF2255 family protein n=1 Tax=Arthrobacter sp. NPDC057009 TaxID=3345996 RepID=UPI003628856C